MGAHVHPHPLAGARRRHPGRAARTLAAGVPGVLLLAAGLATGVPALALEGPDPANVIGTLAMVAGVVLVGDAFRVALAGRRAWTWLLAIPVALVLLQLVVLPAVTAGLVAHAPHDRSPAAATLGLPGARDVTFRAADGVPLRAWYVPGRTGAAVVVLHGSHGSRADTAAHVRMLSRAGYAVLAYDARGHGESGGRTNALGWNGAGDVAAAVAFLRGRPGVDPRRISALGLSMGGEVALRAAAQGAGLAAVVADGAGAATGGDQRRLEGGALAAAVSWVAMRESALVSGVAEPPPLLDLVGRIRVPVLLIASRAHDEARIDELFRARIPGAALWSVPDAGHTAALEVHPAAYARRVQAVLGGAAAGGAR